MRTQFPIHSLRECERPERVYSRGGTGRLCTNNPQQRVEQITFFTFFIFNVIIFLLLQELCAEGACCTWISGPGDEVHLRTLIEAGTLYMNLFSALREVYNDETGFQDGYSDLSSLLLYLA